MIYKQIRLALDSDADISIEWDGNNHYIIQANNTKGKPVVTEEVTQEELTDLYEALGELIQMPPKKRSRKP